MRQALLHFRDHIGRQVLHDVGDFVRIEGLDGIDELIGRHRLNERFAHAVAHFDEHVALVFVIDELPNGQTVIGRERLEHIRNVGRVKCL